jgi:hypothetical protein
MEPSPEIQPPWWLVLTPCTAAAPEGSFKSAFSPEDEKAQGTCCTGDGAGEATSRLAFATPGTSLFRVVHFLVFDRVFASHCLLVHVNNDV